jgi:hypothetical protein
MLLVLLRRRVGAIAAALSRVPPVLLHFAGRSPLPPWLALCSRPPPHRRAPHPAPLCAAPLSVCVTAPRDMLPFEINSSQGPSTGRCCLFSGPLEASTEQSAAADWPLHHSGAASSSQQGAPGTSFSSAETNTKDGGCGQQPPLLLPSPAAPLLHAPPPPLLSSQQQSSPRSSRPVAAAASPGRGPLLEAAAALSAAPAPAAPSTPAAVPRASPVASPRASSSQQQPGGAAARTPPSTPARLPAARATPPAATPPRSTPASAASSPINLRELLAQAASRASAARASPEAGCSRYTSATGASLVSVKVGGPWVLHQGQHRRCGGGGGGGGQCKPPGGPPGSSTCCFQALTHVMPAPPPTPSGRSPCWARRRAPLRSRSGG